MASETLTIRLRPRDRDTLAKAAHTHGSGLSAYVRALAEAEAKKLRDAEIRQGFEPVIQALQESPELRTEFELLGTPQVDLPDEPEEFLRNWVQQAEQLKQQGPA